MIFTLDYMIEEIKESFQQARNKAKVLFKIKHAENKRLSRKIIGEDLERLYAAYKQVWLRDSSRTSGN